MNDTLVDDVLDPSTALSDKQEKTLILLQIGSSVLSLIGSSVIVFKIIRGLHREQSSSPYDRIILGLSSCDVISSLTYAVGPFLLPSDTSDRVWAFGNDTTCTWLGFLTQLACFWAIWYNCILSFYYLLTVRFQVKRTEFTRKYELWMHLSGAIFFPITSVIGLVGDFYSEERYAMICWIGEVPKGCYETGNCWGELVAYIYGAPSTLITLLSLIINNTIIYIFVRKNLGSSPPSTGEDCETGSQTTETSSQRLTVQERLRKEAAIQGFLYVSTFMLTFLPAFAIQVLEGMTKFGDENLAQMYPLLVMNSILLPLQGFFNVFIYVRPSYKRFRAAQPDKPLPFILKKALFDPNIPRISTVILSGDQTRASDKYTEMKKKSGSNFSMTLGNIVEENVTSAVNK